ncbi:hypothetical protein ACFZAV_39865 [Streptomyces sp. NPDC008343]|uniref:hypothetical protein n=1 Tax=Streptomyces sp. NPDC008343 TaxID=3364828 RepID=UPI0036E5D8F7
MGPLLAELGCTISPGVRQRTSAEITDHVAAGGQTGIIDSTGIRGRRPADRWTWLVIAAYAQLRLARPPAADLRRPWEKPAEPTD